MCQLGQIMRSLQFSLFAVVLTLTLYGTLASTNEEDVDRAEDTEKKILVGKEDPEDSKTLESALKISNEDGNIQLKFWFQGDDDSEDEGSEFDNDNDNESYGAVTLDDADGGDGGYDGDDDDDCERCERHRSRHRPEHGRRFYRRRLHSFGEEGEEGDERLGEYRCTRFGCSGVYRYGPYADYEEYINDLLRDYRSRRGLLGQRRRPFLGDDKDDDNDEEGGDD